MALPVAALTACSAVHALAILHDRIRNVTEEKLPDRSRKSCAPEATTTDTRKRFARTSVTFAIDVVDA